MRCRIRHADGALWWNAENDCWTVALVAATIYDAPDDVPCELPGLPDRFGIAAARIEFDSSVGAWYVSGAWLSNDSATNEPLAWSEEV